MTTPVRAIHNYADFENFKKSPAINDILDFVKLCAEAAVGTENTKEVDLSELPAVRAFVELMDRLYQLVEDVPPIKQPMRFGNKAFRDWHAQMVTISRATMEALAAEVGNTEIIEELTPYLSEMFGNPTRIDYGTGHELNFAVYFLILTKMNVLSDSKDVLAAVVTKAFAAYIRTMRRLQTDYMLEPAGSHGVWGLDDYHCLLFLWGSAQLSAQKDIRPADVHNPELLREYAPEYLYFEGIQFIKNIKSSAPFAETSPMLNDISGMADWAKICSGLMRLFQAEVLFKFPVIQHLLFGNVLRCTWASTSGSAPGSAHSTGASNSPTAGMASVHPSVFTRAPAAAVPVAAVPVSASASATAADSSVDRHSKGAAEP